MRKPVEMSAEMIMDRITKSMVSLDEVHDVVTRIDKTKIMIDFGRLDEEEWILHDREMLVENELKNHEEFPGSIDEFVSRQWAGFLWLLSTQRNAVKRDIERVATIASKHGIKFYVKAKLLYLDLFVLRLDVLEETREAKNWR